MDYIKLKDCSSYRKERTTKFNLENYITTENMLSDKGGVIVAESLPDCKTLPKYEVNDILLSNIRPYFKKIWHSNREGGCSNDVLVLKVNNEHNSEFIYYVLSDNNFFNYATVTSKGTKMPRGTPNAIMNYLVPNISIEIENKIVNILSTYDDLIENNNKRIKILEQMAENLYKEWFVRFRFPGYENAEFENGIPKGWKKNKIESYYTTCSGGTPSRSKPQYYENGIYPWIKTGEIKDCIIIDAEEYITQEALDNSSAKIIPANSVIMAMYGVNIGSLAYFADKMTCNQACCVFSDKRSFSSKHYLYNYLKSIREYLLSISFGAAQQNLSQDLIKNIAIVMPTDSIVKEFEAYVDSVYNNIKILLQKNQNLIKQRDLLLPRLMSGKLEVE